MRILTVKAVILTAALAGLTQSIYAQQSNDTLLQSFMKKNNYTQIHLEKNSIGHFVIHGKVNGKDAIFILDTGATGTCIDIASAKKMSMPFFPVKNGESVGYGGDSQDIDTARGIIQLEKYKTDSMTVSVIDLTSVNQAYASVLGVHIDGVIGFDILNGQDAVIDYKGSSLYLKAR